MGRTGIEHIAADRPALGRIVVEAEFQVVARDARNRIAGRNRDRTGCIGLRIDRTVFNERALIGRRDVAVAGGCRERAELRGAGKFEPLAAGVADVLEEAGVGPRTLAADELDVVAQLGPIGRRTPGRGRTDLATRAELDGARYHFLERRIGQKIVRQLARRVRIGAGQLDRRRRTHAFVIRRVRGQVWRRIEIQADGRIESRKGIVAIELRRRARAVLDVDTRQVVAAGKRQCPLLCERPGVGAEDAIVLVAGRRVRVQREAAHGIGATRRIELRFL